MKDLVDYIKYHGYITSIRNKVDKDYIWFDICQKELYKDKNGEDKNNLSFFSARMYIEYSNKIDLSIGKDVYVRGIPKGYVDKKGYRQNYIHVTEYNGINIDENLIDQFGEDIDGTPLWHGKRCESTPPSEEELKEMQEILDSFK